MSGGKPKGKAGSDKNNAPTRAKTAAGKSKMLKALEESKGNITKACESACLDRATHYRWLADDPDYAAAAKAIHEQMLDTLEDHIFSLATTAERHSDQIRASEIYLKARGKDRGYGVEKRDQSVTGGLDIKATVQDVRFELPLNDTHPGAQRPMPLGWEENTANAGDE